MQTVRLDFVWTMTRRAERVLAGALVCCLLPAVAAETRDERRARREVEASAFATCAAYYYNATQAAPMSEYEALYSAGETALNEARRRVDRIEADRMMGDASLAMKSLLDGDWEKFDRVRSEHELRCSELLASVRR